MQNKYLRIIYFLLPQNFISKNGNLGRYVILNLRHVETAVESQFRTSVWKILRLTRPPNLPKDH